MVEKARPKKKNRNKNRNGTGELRFHVPSDIELIDLSNDGLLVPSRLNDKEAYAPLDFTSISSRQVGQQHSHWAVRHSYLIFLVGNLRAELGNLKYDLKNLEAAWMVDHKAEYKNKWEAEHAMRRNKKIARLRKGVVKTEGSLIRYEALAASYQGLMTAASREIARRSDERASRD